MKIRGVVIPSLVCLLFLGILFSLEAQMGFGMRWSRQPDLEVVARYDRDGDGRLGERERRTAREYVRTERASQNLSTGSHPAVPLKSNPATDLQQSAIAAVPGYFDLYDETVLRTLYLRFPDPDWPGELADFFKTDVEVPADLIVDGRLYPQVGVRFRGNSSYFMLGNSLKKSFSISIDYLDEDQRLYGYRTLDLLNGHADPSFMRTVLFSRISRQYIPAPKANFVRLVINGENWGVYINVQQFNNDFLAEWFGTTDGVRWKVPAGRNSGGGLAYNGSDPDSYRRSFELNTKDNPEAWDKLIELCDILTNTPIAELEQRLSGVFDIDGALWFLALENVFIDSDGYISRGSDYYLYQDSQGRFHPITHDNNETFRYAGGGGPNRWPSSDPMLSPVGHEDNPSLPVISRLLAVPHLRARYLAHIRTIVEQWLDWKVLGPLIEEYQALIAGEVEKDDKKLYPYEAFAGSIAEASNGYGWYSTPSFKSFIGERREFLLAHPEISRAAPEILWLRHRESRISGEPIVVTAKVRPQESVNSVLLHYAIGDETVFTSIAMQEDGGKGSGTAADGVFAGEIPAVPIGTRVRYYVEARSVDSLGTTVFAPRSSELGARIFRSGVSAAESSPVVINELLALNSRSIADPQGEFDDWIELYNRGDSTVDLSGMYLSDRAAEPRKWMFPRGTTIPPRGFLVVWADEDGEDKQGIHANFKLSGNGEQLLLIDTDIRGNRVLDSIDFGYQRQDISYGRLPDGSGEFRSLYVSPGRSNGP
ncbi:MAG: CotH kinase family protein [Spirochaetaceae bacterium]|nr:MAG: CotH kinase family protein [Spirochaetaceae bacterium]